MFQVYLPIAEMSVHVLLILALGGVTGMLSGLFGVGGGFLVTPFLMFIGIPPTVAVATSANQIAAASVSGFLNQWRRGNVDIMMGNILLIGGIAGSTLGIVIFKWLQTLGQIDLVIALAYVFFLGTIGSFMARDSWRAHKQIKAPASTPFYQRFQRLPFKASFKRSNLEISLLVPLVIGFVIGILASIMGIGGGFLLIPAMIYLLGMPTALVVGTSLYQTIFIAGNVTLLHAWTTHTVDLMLALLLIFGSVIGAQIGSRYGARLPAAQLRGFLALLVLLVALKLAYGLFVTPEDVFTINWLRAS